MINLGTVEKPKLIIEYMRDGDLLQGRCSECFHTVFNLKGDSLEQKARLGELFDLHFNRVHVDETP